MLVFAMILAGIAVFACADRDSGDIPPKARAVTADNLAVFDAACRLIDQHYFDQEVLGSEAWKQYQAIWRGKARDAEPQQLYLNVLNNFATGLPSSHVAFEPPATRSPDPVPKSTPVPQPGAVNMAELGDLLASGPGFDAVSIRRDGFTQTVVGELTKDSPAERAGVSPGWIVLSTTLNATQAGARFSASLLPLDEAGMRAADSTGLPPAVKTLAELGEFAKTRAVQFDFSLRKRPTRSAFEERAYGDIIYVRFDGFDAAGDASKALAAMDRARSAGLIVDLRFNRGGRGLELLRFLGSLHGHGVVAGHQISRSGDKSPVTSVRLGGHYEGPVILLVGPATSSAAEIAAAAVQDHERGTLIGRRTNGSVVSGSKFDLPDGGKIMIPVKDFIRVDGRRIEGIGVEPDIWMLPTLEDVRQGRDPLLEKALAILKATH